MLYPALSARLFSLGKPSMSFAQRLAAHARDAEARLAALLDAEAAGGAPERLVAAMRHAVLAGGKRFRPLLVRESAALFGVSPAAAVDTAAALECLHCYSLVHDDLPAMDNDALRRGQPTVHVAYDEWTAILAGDALLTLAFAVLGRPETHADPAVRLALVSALADAAGGRGMVGGQCLDLEADKLGAPARPDVAHIRRLQAMKTGRLLRFAVEAGAILGQAAAAERAALAAYGDAIGFAFQIADDLLDADGTVEDVGKAVAKDAAQGKATLVSLMGREAAREKLAAVEAEAIGALEPFGSRAGILIEAARFVSRRTR
jgi:farnesyl diphosphate synthase